MGRRDEVYRELTELVAKGVIHVEDIRKKLPRLGLANPRSYSYFLALVKNKVAILDDKRARKPARELGLEVIGALLILNEAIRRRHLERST